MESAAIYRTKVQYTESLWDTRGKHIYLQLVATGISHTTLSWCFTQWLSGFLSSWPSYSVPYSLAPYVEPCVCHQITSHKTGRISLTVDKNIWIKTSHIQLKSVLCSVASHESIITHSNASLLCQSLLSSPLQSLFLKCISL